MQMTFLGTGSGLPSRFRNVSSLALDMSTYSEGVWLFDCGEATQHQILKTSIRPRKIEKIFITHLHGDHFYGLPGLLSSRSFLDGHTAVDLYGPDGLADYINTAFKVSKTKLSYPLRVHTITDGQTIKTKHFTIIVKSLAHGVSSFGFKICERDQIGPLNVERLLQLGVSPSPLYKKIKENKVTQLADGRLIKREDVVGPVKKGRIVTILGDTGPVDDLVSFISGSDVLIHEATYESKLRKMARLYNHSTIDEACINAKKANVGHLYINHLSQRYDLNNMNQLESEAQAIFKKTTFTYDLLKIDIKKN